MAAAFETHFAQAVSLAGTDARCGGCAGRAEAEMEVEEQEQAAPACWPAKPPPGPPGAAGSSPFAAAAQQAAGESLQLAGAGAGGLPALPSAGSAPQPGTPQQCLPAIRISRGDSGASDALLASPAAAAAAAPPGDGAVAPEQGWFFNCRGCGSMTAYERRICDADVPFCRRCQHMLSAAEPAMQGKMLDTLIYVHRAWANAGL
ncbi:hypothetical protein HT031_006756 [Scenedesmus sp. PABB004]|nr:hypothetical protein HT031_006756 [Scenedesmus sp. PABB004]